MTRPRLLGTLIVLLALSAVSLAAAQATKSSSSRRAAGRAPVSPEDSNAVLVRVGAEAITRRSIDARLAEIPEQYRATYSTPDGRRQLLDRLIEEKLWLQDAARNGVDKRETIVRQLEQQRRDLLVRTWVNEVMATNPAPSDSEAMAEYEARREEFKTPATVTLRHILLKKEFDARRVAGMAKAKGADWGKLVTQFSVDTLTRGNGGMLGTATREGAFTSIGTQPALAESAMALGEGKVGGPYRTDRGWHVLQVERVTPDGERSFDQVRSFLVRQMTQQRQQQFYQQALEKTRSRIGVTPDSAVIRSFLSARKTAREMFQEAQNAGGPEARIAAYRRVVEAWPAADVTPQALFMVGFIQSEELKAHDEAEKAFRELLQRYPRSELTASAQWMIDHMRTEEAPDFLQAGGDTTAVARTPQK
jgi:parvulin-like peptidyl-prolyl isomerase